MKNQLEKYTALGLMSGTSLDGLDICLSEFEYNKSSNTWEYKILEAETYAYDELWKEKLHTAVNLPAEELLKLHSEYGFYLGEKVNEFLESFSVSSRVIEGHLVSSHGHTIFHQPENGFTFQIGHGGAIAKTTGLQTVSDFRIEDVLLGGQGAPLVPIGDKLLFSEYEACLNLGGFSNISFEKQGQRIAFDISPVNIVLNRLCKRIGLEYDDKGKIARNAVFNQELLEELNHLSFYHQDPPKSLGFEWVEKNIQPLLEKYRFESTENLIATITHHAAIQIAKVLQENAIKNVLITGGGAYNDFLIESIGQKTQTEIVIPESKLLEFKESLIFAFLGVLKITQNVNILSSVTGASQNHCSGIIFNP